jgi:hypothetical protein
MNKAQMLAHLELPFIELVLSISEHEYYSSMKVLVDKEESTAKVEFTELSYYGYVYQHRVGNFTYYHFVHMRKVDGYPELESEAFYKEPYRSTEDILKEFEWLLSPMD